MSAVSVRERVGAFESTCSAVFAEESMIEDEYWSSGKSQIASSGCEM